MLSTPRNEYPRPDFVRDSWMTLNGKWDFGFSKSDLNMQINVPFAYQTQLSGINIQDFHDTVWYKRQFNLPPEMEGKRIILHFGAVDYYCRVWVNEGLAGEHTGGQIGFSFDITHMLNSEGANSIVVMAEDNHLDMEMPRGKQFWKQPSESIFYTPTTGIWQSVWLEAVNAVYLKRVWITPLLDERSVKIEYEADGCIDDLELEAVVSFNGIIAAKHRLKLLCKKSAFTLEIQEKLLGSWNFVEDLVWSPETPRLFDIAFRLYKSNAVVDEVTSYFGMRKISVQNGIVMLNNRPYYQKLVLDQGYWEESLMTAPTDEDFVKDIMLVKKLGFNGVRKHQKVEDPRFLYHADRLGLLVWSEVGAAYSYSQNYVKAITEEWVEAIFRDYNHPCIIAWTPLNESWGIADVNIDKRQQAHVNAMYYLTKSIDGTRLVIDNDGWEHTCGDLLSIHDYESNRSVLRKRYESKENILCSMPAGRPLYANGWKYKGQPVIISEFGGISYTKKSNGWGYSSADNGDEFLELYRNIVEPLLCSNEIQGFCYTQLTDVEQETNGLLTAKREPKADLLQLSSVILGNTAY